MAVVVEQATRYMGGLGRLREAIRDAFNQCARRRDDCTYFRKEALLQYSLARRLHRLGFAKRIGDRLVIDMRKCGVNRLYL